VTSAAAQVTDELVRDARARYAQERLELRATAAFTAGAVAVTSGVVATAIFLHGGPAFSLLRLAFFVALYTVVSRVEFEVGAGLAVPTEIVLVPMIFALPIGLVPAAVLAALLLRTAWDRPFPLRDPSRIAPRIIGAAHTLGPVLLIGLAHGLPLRWSAWPIYVAALGLQFAGDFASALLDASVNNVKVSTLVGFVWLAYAVDAALAPIGLAVAIATRPATYLAVIVLPLVLLLRSFSRERERRIDGALELSDAYRGTAFLLGDVVEADDAYTGSHSRHVVELVLSVAGELKLSPSDRRDAEFVALLHDVGKIRIPSEIINKPGALNAEERAIIETHTTEGERMLEQVGGLIGHVGRLVRSCHERWDGAGYPDRLAGTQIPLIARIVCACDAFSAMTTDRPYRAALTRNEALAELARCSGTQFDPQVVAAILRLES
jgi:HD-GYP domain-containing protein (c-di-GMP phosphodiesterase class II)